MPDRQRIIAGAAAFVIMVVAVGGGLFILRGRGPANAASKQAFVFVDGQRLQPPFKVTTQAATVLVNGKLAANLAPVKVDDPRPTPAAADSAFTIVSEMRRAYLDGGTGDKGVAAALAMLRSHPAAPKFQELQGPHAIEVTDASGETGSFRIDVPDAVARPIDQAGHEQAAKDTAADWRALLAQGGGIATSMAGGVTLMIPPAQVASFLTSLEAARVQTGAARDSALATLLEMPGLITDFGGSLPPLTPRPTAARTNLDAALPVSLVRRPATTNSVPGAPAAGIARTPGKAEAIVFAMTELNDNDSQPFITATRDEHYRVTILRNPRDGLYTFFKTSDTGALYIVSHSSPGNMAVEHFANADGINASMQSLLQRGAQRSDMDWWSDGSGGFWLDITRSGINRLWFGAQTIVHAASCTGESLFNVFGAREYFGYAATTSCTIALPDTTELWSRLSGVIGDGQYRYASVAFSTGHYSQAFRYHDGSPNEDTALSPAIVRADIPQGLEVGDESAVLIGFDTVMDTKVGADGVIAVLGCLGRSGPAQWQFDSLLSVPVVAEKKGGATVTISALLATSAIAHVYLDGNLDPQRKSGVAPNKDDWQGAGGCVETTHRTAPATPGSSFSNTVTPTPTPPTVRSTTGSGTTNGTTGTQAPPVVPIHADFNQSAFTTVYTEKLPSLDGLTFQWSVNIPTDPNCGTGFKGNIPGPNQASWFHADNTENGPCNHNVPGPNGHPGTVTLVVNSATYRCEARYAGTNTGDGSAPECIRK